MLETDALNTTAAQHSPRFPMARHANARTKPLSPFYNLKDWVVYLGGTLLVSALLLVLWSHSNPILSPDSVDQSLNDTLFLRKHYRNPAPNLRYDPPDVSFYDDPEMRYALGARIVDWDDKRMEWLQSHPSFAPGSKKRVVMVTGSQSRPCKNPSGDHFLLRTFKNKVDYCRMHGYDVFYDSVLLQPKMSSYWAKYPAVKAAMVAHPEAEWIWWVDSDAVITDMEFQLPLERYDRKGHNLVVHGWHGEVFEKHSWTGLNAGVFLVRNCQWSMDFLEKWAAMGPMNEDFQKWGAIQRSIFKNKLFPESDDQTALAYMLVKDPDLTNFVYLEGEYYLEGYWVDIVPTYSNISDMYAEIEREDSRLRRRHAEKVSLQYAAFRERHLKRAGNGKGSWRRPFITHFTGCQPCSGAHNQMYDGHACWESMIRALNFADNQVLRKYGFIRPDITNSDTVVETGYNYPDDGLW